MFNTSVAVAVAVAAAAAAVAIPEAAAVEEAADQLLPFFLLAVFRHCISIAVVFIIAMFVMEKWPCLHMFHTKTIML